MSALTFDRGSFCNQANPVLLAVTLAQFPSVVSWPPPAPLRPPLLPQQAMLPATLDQYSRSCLQGYTGYRPKGGAAASAVIPAQGPTAETTTGMVNQQVNGRPLA